MRRCILCASGIVIAVSLAGCGGSPEDATAKESIAVMNEMAGIFESIKDPASAKEAEGKLKALSERGQALDKKMKELPKDKVEAARKKYDAEGKAAVERMMTAMMKATQSGFKLDPTMLGPRP